MKDLSETTIANGDTVCGIEALGFGVSQNTFGLPAGASCDQEASKNSIGVSVPQRQAQELVCAATGLQKQAGMGALGTWAKLRLLWARCVHCGVHTSIPDTAGASTSPLYAAASFHNNDLYTFLH